MSEVGMGRGWAWCVAVMIGQAGCFGTCGPDPGPGPCEFDRLRCDGDPTDFEQLEDCAVTEPLAVSIGQGEGAFEAFAEGEGPELFYGFQGGQHVFVGFRVDNAALDLYSQLRVTMWLAQGEACAAGPATAQVPASCPRDLGLRQVVIGGQASTLRVVDGVVEEFGLLLIVEQPTFGMRSVVAVEVEDPCGRTGVASATWTSR